MSTGKSIGPNGPVSSPEPLASTIVGVILSFSAISVLSCFLAHKFLAVKDWWRLPLITWLVVAIYVDSWIFVFGTAIIDYGIGVDSNLGVCSAAILLCLFCYISTKLIYTFLAEKAFIIRCGTQRRLESKLYLFNTFGILTVYGIICILSSVYRVARMEDDQCIIGIKRQALIPLITFDILVNIYLTVLFLSPLQNIYLGKGLARWPPNPPRLRAAGMRTFIGALATTTSSVVNLTVLMVLDGELGWVCLMCCNADILFSALIIQWLTARDNSRPATATTAMIPSSGGSGSDKPSAPSSTPSRPRTRRRGHRPTISLPLNATSTSQYEHIFGDPELDGSQPAPDAPTSTTHLEADVTNTNNKVGAAPTTITSAAKSPGGTGTTTATTANGTTISYFSFDDSDLTPVAGDDSEIDIGTGAGAVVTRGRSNNKGPSSRPHPTTTTTTTSPTTHAEDPLPRMTRASRQRESGATNGSGSNNNPVTAAVAADLERIRLYRQRRPTPSRAALAVAQEAGDSSYPYRISHLAFEGGEDRWYDFERSEEEGKGETGPAGWI